MNRTEATSEEVTEALLALDAVPFVVPAKAWPASLDGVAQPGLYAWWTDEAGAATLSRGLGHEIQPGRIYAGQTGATKWPSGRTGKSTLRSRIGNNHLRGRIRGSTFRLTLASVLAAELSLIPAGPKKLDRPSETALSGWIESHLSVAVHPFPDADALADPELQVPASLVPALNLDGMPSTPARASLSELRADLLRRCAVAEA